MGWIFIVRWSQSSSKNKLSAHLRGKDALNNLESSLNHLPATVPAPVHDGANNDDNDAVEDDHQRDDDDGGSGRNDNVEIDDDVDGRVLFKGILRHG